VLEIGTYALPEGPFASFVIRRTHALGITGSSGPYGHLDRSVLSRIV